MLTRYKKNDQMQQDMWDVECISFPVSSIDNCWRDAQAVNCYSGSTALFPVPKPTVLGDRCQAAQILTCGPFSPDLPAPTT